MLFNDRYGMHRLYYHQAKEAFYFAAEAKAILAVRPELRALMIAVWVSSLPAAACLRIARFSKGFLFCRRVQPGSSGTLDWKPETAAFTLKSGKRRPVEIEADDRRNCAVCFRAICLDI